MCCFCSYDGASRYAKMCAGIGLRQDLLFHSDTAAPEIEHDSTDYDASAQLTVLEAITHAADLT